MDPITVNEAINRIFKLQGQEIAEQERQRK